MASKLGQIAINALQRTQEVPFVFLDRLLELRRRGISVARIVSQLRLQGQAKIDLAFYGQSSIEAVILGLTLTL